jgi:aldehyde dehydrogenase (NAD+)
MFTVDSFFIGGTEVSPISDRRLDVISPRNGVVVGRIPVASTEDVDSAVQAARGAFDKGIWSKSRPKDRADVLRNLATSIENHASELTDLSVEEVGMPIVSAEMSAPHAAYNLRNFAQLAESIVFEEERLTPFSRSLVVREPVGVVVAIPAWNGPLTLGLQKVGAALAAGCTVVWKVPVESPLTSYLFTTWFHDAGLPAGVVNVLSADVVESEYLIAHPGVDMVSFTGSTVVGRRIAEACGRDLRRVALELGGKSAAVVLDDADFSKVVPAIVGASAGFRNGEACTAQTRILVPRSRYDEAVVAFGACISELRVGDPFERATQIGPLVTDKHRLRVERYIDIGRREGAAVVTGGGRPSHMAAGWYVEPTLFANASNDMTICREEIFGPVAALIAHDGIDDAIAIANDSPYGLAGTVWTESETDALRVAREVRTGTFCVNSYTVDPHTPFGGFKASGIGRELGPEGVDEFFELKSIVVEPKRVDVKKPPGDVSARVTTAAVASANS